MNLKRESNQLDPLKIVAFYKEDSTTTLKQNVSFTTSVGKNHSNLKPEPVGKISSENTTKTKLISVPTKMQTKSTKISKT